MDSKAEGGGTLIPCSKIPPCVRRVYGNGVRHFDDALCLYGARRMQGAIASLVLSVEEHLKGLYLAAAHRGGRGISDAEWGNLQEHDFKLHKVRPKVDRSLDREALVAACGQYALNTMDPLTAMRSADSASAARCNNEIAQITPTLRLLARACTYHNWSRKNSGWDTFGLLPEDAQGAIAVHVLHIAKFYRDLLLSSAGEWMGLPRHRAPDDTCQLPKSPLGSCTGRAFLKILQETRSVSSCAHEMTSRILDMCARAMPARVDDASLHPLVRAVRLCASEPPLPGNAVRTRTADDAAQTRDEPPAMRVSVSMSTQNGLRRIERVTINQTPCSVYDGRIPIVLAAEAVIGREPGPDVPLPALGELLSRLGITPYGFRDRDIWQALANARGMLDGGRLRGYPARIVDSIRSATVENWRGVDPQARHVMAALLVSDPTAIELGEPAGPMPKHMARRLVWDALCAQKSVYDGGGAPA